MKTFSSAQVYKVRKSGVLESRKDGMVERENVFEIPRRADGLSSCR